MFKKQFFLKIVPIGIMIAFLSMAQFKIFYKNFDKYLVSHIEAAKGVVEGYPHWRIFQNRVTGPYAVEFTQKVTGLSFPISYLLTIFLWMMVFYSIMMVVSISIRPSLIFAFGTSVGAAFFNSLLMYGLWLYTWDIIDLSIFTLFIWAIIKKKPIGYLVCIIVFETFNREVSLILSGWLLFDALVMILPSPNTGKFPIIAFKFNKKQFIVALLLIAFVIFTVEYLRDTLLIRQIGPEFFRDYKGQGGLVMVQFWDNFDFLFFSFIEIKGLKSIYSLLNILLLGAGILGVFSRDRQVIRASVLYLVLWIFTLVFGVIYETRVWLSYVPFIAIVCPMILNDMEERLSDEKKDG